MATPPIDIPKPGAAATDDGPVVTPAIPSSTDALARFEYETGKGKKGTKILMVEWSTASKPVADATATWPATPPDDQDDQWEVSWPGKMIRVSGALSERDGAATQRVYFLLPEKAAVPGLVTISQLPAGRTLHAKPLPAIYTPRLGFDPARDAGKRGVLHTIWAKKRLAELKEEMRREEAMNSETIHWALAQQEHAWLADQFGLVVTSEGGSTADAGGAATGGDAPPTPQSPQSPQSPVGGRLSEKLRGLKLATSPSDLAQSRGSHQPPQQQQHHLYSLSPDASDIAVPSKADFAAHTANGRAGGPAAAMGSLNAIVGDPPKTGPGALESKEPEEDLFALPMSPRSPEMTKSPYSLL